MARGPYNAQVRHTACTHIKEWGKMLTNLCAFGMFSILNESCTFPFSNSTRKLLKKRFRAWGADFL